MAKAEPVVETEEVSVHSVQSRSKLLILLAFSAIVLLEMILLLWLLPKSSVPSQEGSQVNDTNIPALPIDVIPSLRPEDFISHPIDGTFTASVVSEDGAGGYLIGAQFVLKCEKSKQSRFTKLYGLAEADIKALIMTILRSSKVEDINDPNLTVMRKKILQKINEEIFGAEPQPLVKEVLVVDFRATPM